MADEYDPYLERSGHIMTNNLETFIHLVKSSLGTGILAMPRAFSHAGLAEGAVLVFVLGTFCVYGLHLLINNLYLVCKDMRVPIVQYGDGFQGALAMGPSWLEPLRAPSIYVVEFFLLTYQLGIGCIYIAFAAKNLAQVANDSGEGHDGRGGHGGHGVEMAFMTGVAAFELCLFQIRNLRLLAPVSLLANLAMLAGQVLIWYHLLRSPPPLPSPSSRPQFGPIGELPNFMGIVLFAMESLGVIISLENNMARPASFTGLRGILNAGMLVVVSLYAFMGFFGYLRYGDKVADVITLNLPPGEGTSLAVQVVYALSIVLTYPLQLWPVMEVLWGKYLTPQWISPEGKWYWLWETLCRSVIVLFTYAIAISLPNLDFIISLLGVFCLSMLGITFPALMEMCTHYKVGYGKLKWMLFKDAAIASIGAFVMVIGLYTNIADIASVKSEESPQESE